MASGSSLLITVFRAGAMANLGHNHAIRCPLQGEVDPDTGAVLLRSAIADWQVDAVADRAIDEQRFPGEFSKQPSPGDIEGTRHNMTGSDLLNAITYPQLSVSGEVSVEALLAGEASPAAVVIELAGQRHAATITVQLASHDAAHAIVRGGWTTTHAALGLTPFSVFGGAIRVRDDIDIQYQLELVAPEP